MNTQATNKPNNKVTAKPNTTKAANDQEKVINQLRQEIRTLSKTVKDMQQKPDTQAVIITMPQELLSRINVYLSEVSKSVGLTMSLSELTCEALNLYLWAEEDNKRLEEEREKVELENKKGK